MRKTTILLIAAFIVLSIGAIAERLPVDSVVAVVNDDVILASEVGEEINVRVYQYGPEAINSIGMSNFTAQILQEMIDNRLLLQKADELEIIVSRDDVDPLVEDNISAMKEQYPTDEEFEAMLQQYGMTEKKLRKQYRKSIKEQITIKNLVDIEIMPNIEVDEEDARAYYEINKSEFDIPIMVGISEIVIAKKISPETERKTKTRADEVRAKALRGIDFTTLVGQYSAGGNAASGGYFNFSTGETYPELEAAAESLSPGEVSEPIALPDGFWVLKLLEKRDDTYKTQVILVPIGLTAADIADARNKAERAHGELDSGKAFVEVAVAYNEESEVPDVGGYVGQFVLWGLQRDFPKIASELEMMQPGEYTPVVERPEGFYIVKLEERSEGESRDYAGARDEVVNELRMEKLDEEINKYVEELKEESYIKVVQEE